MHDMYMSCGRNINYYWDQMGTVVTIKCYRDNDYPGKYFLDKGNRLEKTRGCTEILSNN